MAETIVPSEVAPTQTVDLWFWNWFQVHMHRNPHGAWKRHIESDDSIAFFEPWLTTFTELDITEAEALEASEYLALTEHGKRFPEHHLRALLGRIQSERRLEAEAEASRHRQAQIAEAASTSNSWARTKSAWANQPEEVRERYRQIVICEYPYMANVPPKFLDVTAKTLYYEHHAA
jgi:hypothetical protein